MRDVRPILYRVPDFEPSTEPPGGLPPDRCRGVEPPPRLPSAGTPSDVASSGEALSPGPPVPLSARTPSVRIGARTINSARETGAAPDESRGAVSNASTTTCVPAKKSTGCRTRIDRKSLRANRSAPAGIRRAHRAGHSADDRTEPIEAQEFAGKALRILLEVLDRRRPVAQLNTLCAPALIHAVGALVAGDHAPSRTLGAAVLTKFRLFSADDHAFELIAMYQRGPRRLALAGRVEHTATGWKLTALRLT